jgi:hypothetical protein
MTWMLGFLGIFSGIERCPHYGGIISDDSGCHEVRVKQIYREVMDLNPKSGREEALKREGGRSAFTLVRCCGKSEYREVQVEDNLTRQNHKIQLLTDS